MYQGWCWRGIPNLVEEWEEYRGQLGDRMPIALEAMTKASVKAGIVTEDMIAQYGSASGAMEKLMEQGKLLSKDILPFFGEQIRKVIDPGFDRAMESNIAWMNRLKNASEGAAYSFYRGGFEEGLTDLFKSSAAFMKDTEDLWSGLGAIIGSVLKGISKFIKVITPVFESFGYILKGVTDMFGDFAGLLAGIVSPTILMGMKSLVGNMSSMEGFLKMMTKPMSILIGMAKRFALPFLLVLGTLEEITNLVKKDKKGILYDAENPTQNPLNILAGISGEKERIQQKPEESFLGRLGSVANAGMRGSPLEIVDSVRDLWTGGNTPTNQTVQVVLDGEVVGETVINSESAKEGVRREVYRQNLPNQ